MMKNSLTNKMKKEFDDIPISQEKIDGAIEAALKRGNKKKLFSGRGVSTYLGAAMILLGLLAGSAVISPTMAEMVSKIPYLNQLFQSEEPGFGKFGMEDLTEKGYNVSNFGIDYRTKTIHVGIEGTQAYYDEVKNEIKNLVSEAFKEQGMDAFKVKISRVDQDKRSEEPSTDQQKKIDEYIRRSSELEKSIMTELKRKGFDIRSAHVRINDIEKFIPLEVLVSEKRIDEMKEIVKEIAAEKETGEFKIKVYKIDPIKEEAEQRWSPVISTIAQGLMGKKDFHVKGVGYSFYPSPLTITIKTSVKSSEPDTEKIAEKIEMEVRRFIESDEVKDKVKDDPYNIIVYSKDKKEIN
jgi:nitrogen regulatory protein PII